VFFSDGWDGYPLARQRLLQHIVDAKVANPVVLGGDIHFFCVADLKLDFAAERSPAVASEFVTTSISSQSWPQAQLEKRLPDNPHVRYLNSTYRGYTRLEVTGEQMQADLRIVESVTDPLAPSRTLASFVVESGRPGAVRA
jgi:alkaline phosphatase D